MGEFFDSAFNVDLSDLVSDEPSDQENTEQESSEETDQEQSSENNSDSESQTESSESNQESGGQNHDQETDHENSDPVETESSKNQEEQRRMSELMQKAQSYDVMQRQYMDLLPYRQKYELLYNRLSETAKENNMDVDSLIDSFQIAQYRKSGATESEAKTMLENAKLKYQLQQQEVQKNRENSQRNEIQEKAKRDLQQFMDIYGNRKDIDFHKLPKEVLEQAQKTSLVDAFSRYEAKRLQKENEELKRKLEAAQKNKENKHKSPGSVSSSESAQAKDKFLDAFMSDD